MQGIKNRGAQSPEQARAAASWAISTNRNLLGRFVRRAAYASVQGAARNILTVFVGERKGEESELRGRFDYHDGLVLEEAEIGLDVVEAAVAQCFDRMPVVGLTMPERPTFTTVRWSSLNGLSSWPGTLVWFEGQGKGEVPYAHEPVTGPGETHRYFPNMYTAAASWCRFPGFHGANDTRVGGFALFLPDLRGRLGHIERDADTAEIEVVIDTPRADQWRVKGGYYHRDEWVDFNLPATPPRTCVPFRGSYYELSLVDDAGNIVDHWLPSSRSAGRREVTRKAVEVPELLSHVATCLELGECQTVECKPALHPSGGNETITEVVQTVVAFANTDGGTILIGVTDRLEPRDLLGTPEFRKWRSKANAAEDDDEALRQYANALVDAVRLQLEKLPNVTASIVALPGANLVALRVEPGGAIPYYVREGAILVRRGASVRQAHPEREPHLFAAVGREA